MPERRQRTAGLVSTAAIALLLVAGCSSPSTPAAGPASVTVDSGSTPGMTGASTASPASDAPAGANAVTIGNFAFAPASITIPTGTTITWTNKDEEPHTVVSGDGTTFHSPGMGTGATFSFTFPNAGTFEYVCSIHPMMHGTVVVTK